MILSDTTIKEVLAAGRISIDPLVEANIQPASVDLRLADTILVFQNSKTPFIDLKKPIPNLMGEVKIPVPDPFIIHPGEFALGSTLETVTLAEDIVGHIEGKSSLGRVGLMIHSTAGFVDPGWNGRLTLELANVSRLPITLYAGMNIAQIAFQELTTRAERPYGSPNLASRYQGQEGAVASRAYLDFQKEKPR